MASHDAPRGPYNLVTVNTAPDRAQRLVSIAADALKDSYEIRHVANCTSLDAVEPIIREVMPDLLFCASMWTPEEAVEIQAIARKVKPDIAIHVIPPGLQVQHGPEAIVDHLKCIIPRFLNDNFGRSDISQNQNGDWNV